jgi:hypothetical protein
MVGRTQKKSGGLGNGRRFYCGTGIFLRNGKTGIGDRGLREEFQLTH